MIFLIARILTVGWTKINDQICEDKGDKERGYLTKGIAVSCKLIRWWECDIIAANIQKEEVNS